MRPNHSLLWLASVAPATLLLGLSLTGLEPTAIRTPLALLSLGMVGYLLQHRLLSGLALNCVARAALGLALGLAALALLAFPLALLPGGLSALGWAAVVWLLTLALAWRIKPGWLSHGLGARWRQALLPAFALGLAGVGVVLALRLASLGALAAPSTGFTVLWLLPLDESGQRYRIGVRNAEQMPVTYQVQVLADGALLRDWPLREYEPEAARLYELALPAGFTAPAHIQVLLYRGDAPDQVYRRVDYWSTLSTRAP
jgi:hypothetical protein